MRSLLFWLGVLPCLAMASSPMREQPSAQRARQLKDFLKKERPRFEKRESQRRDVLGELDELNAQQNRVRERIASIEQNHQEMNMALDNLSMELEKEKSLERLQKKRLLLLLKIVYKVRKDGLMRFLITGDQISNLAGRVRILYHSLKSHTLMTQELEARATRLSQAEHKVEEAKEGIQRILAELTNQEDILNGLLTEKRKMLLSLNQKQSYFQSALKEYKQVSKQLASLFDNFESDRDSAESLFPSRGTLPLPVAMGRVITGFGRSVNGRFHTVIYHKGIEIESDHNTPVAAVLPGTVEYEGWVKGLGNVLILHHGGGFYSLSAHLFKTLKAKGAQVGQGETIGYVGDTGSDEKPSLYFELRENGKAVDPLMYFNPKALQALK